MNQIKNPKISVITVNLNNKEGLLKTITSVVSQTFKDFEYILIDGASSDGSIDVIKQFSDKLSYWSNEPDTGVYNAMNKGIKMASGEYCLFLNSGDFLCNKSVLEDVFLKQKSCDIIYGNLMYDNGTQISYLKQPEKLTFSYLFSKYLFHPATFIKRDLFERIGKYNDKMLIASDYEFIFKAIVIHDATTEYVSIPVSQHDNKGISSLPENFSLVISERNEVHKKYLPKIVIEEMNNLNYLSRFKYFNSLKEHPVRKKIISFLLDKF